MKKERLEEVGRDKLIMRVRVQVSEGDNTLMESIVYSDTADS